MSRRDLPFILGMKVERLAIGYPWVSPFIWQKHHQNVLNLERPSGLDIRWFQGQGWCPARRHIHLCEQAVEWGASHILILGSDQIFPENLIPRLIERVEVDGCEVITAMVPTRGLVPWVDMKPFQPVAYRFKDGMKANEYKGWDVSSDMIDIIMPDESPELVRVDFIGSGCIMFPVDDLLTIQKPWFDETFTVDEYKRHASMDTRFIWKLKVIAGAQIWVDTTIKIGHLNDMIIDDSYQHRFSRDDWQEQGYGSAPANIK